MNIIRIMPCLALCLMMHTGAWAKMDKGDYDKLKAKTDVYLAKVKADREWLASRLQMYWTSHATDVYMNGETFDHAGGGRAPNPTVKFNGTRSNGAQYGRPKLEDVVPYDDDDNSNVTFVSNADGKKEKVHPSKTGCNIAALNRQIICIARDAARIYAENGDRQYAEMAAHVFDVYLKGIRYRNVPIDLNHGHQQTLVGMTTFEVIHEDAVNEITEIYSLLADYFDEANRQAKEDLYDREIYDTALKKWAENIIANGVPHNNWNLYQAEFIFKIAQVLGDDAAYSDGKGRQYYTDYIVNQSSLRQWSMKRLAEFGFDMEKGVWYESPGYSMGVIDCYCKFANEVDKKAGADLFAEIPVLTKSALSSAQYLFPNRMVCGFGDTHPSYISTASANSIIEYAKRHGKEDLQREFEAFRSAVAKDAPEEEIGRYVSPTFHAPNVSWIMQRTGMDRRHDLAVSVNGSLGNHQHANGISMELYGKGYVLAPDAGIGKNLYSGLDYLEYYSQFPAHNTVCVDGISSYPVMMSAHGFDLVARHPEDERTGTESPVTFSQVAFTEPESQSEQMRTNGIVKVSGTGGYYIDIFRSRKKEGGDKMHDYFYHNLGQTMTLTAADGETLGLSPTDELSFAGGHLYAYSYIYDKKSATTAKDVKATFKMAVSEDRRAKHGIDESEITMTMWMRGDSSRQVFQALSPVNMEYERMDNQPYDIIKQPVLTFVARQQGEAWTHPFVCVFEPSSDMEPGEIADVRFFTPVSDDKSAVGIEVTMKSGRKDYIFSAAEKGTKMEYGGMKVEGIYAVISDGKVIVNK